MKNDVLYLSKQGITIPCASSPLNKATLEIVYSGLAPLTFSQAVSWQLWDDPKKRKRKKNLRSKQEGEEHPLILPNITNVASRIFQWRNINVVEKKKKEKQKRNRDKT